MCRPPFLRLSLYSASFLFLFCPGAGAQSAVDTGSACGIVQDQSGAGISGVTAELHGVVCAHWWLSFAPHQVSFPLASQLGEEDERERKVRVL